MGDTEAAAAAAAATTTATTTGGVSTTTGGVSKDGGGGGGGGAANDDPEVVAGTPKRKPALTPLTVDTLEKSQNKHLAAVLGGKPVSAHAGHTPHPKKDGVRSCDLGSRTIFAATRHLCCVRIVAGLCKNKKDRTNHHNSFLVSCVWQVEVVCSPVTDFAGHTPHANRLNGVNVSICLSALYGAPCDVRANCIADNLLGIEFAECRHFADGRKGVTEESEAVDCGTVYLWWQNLV